MIETSALVPADALTGVRVGLSVSNSADLFRLGLAPQHCNLALVEIARAVLIAGGSLVYGGRLIPTGFTQILLDEVRRFSTNDEDSLTVCLAASEHSKLSNDELVAYIEDLHSSAEIVCLDQDGNPVRLTERDLESPVDEPRALSGLRRYLTNATKARLLLGGKLADFKGSMPGVIEEALFAMQAQQPLYVAGGFGGAAAAVAATLAYDDFAWAAPGFPASIENAKGALEQLAEVASAGMSADGLSPAARRQLAVAHRPADIAALFVLGLSRAVA